MCILHMFKSIPGFFGPSVAQSHVIGASELILSQLLTFILSPAFLLFLILFLKKKLTYLTLMGESKIAISLQWRGFGELLTCIVLYVVPMPFRTKNFISKSQTSRDLLPLEVMVFPVERAQPATNQGSPSHFLRFLVTWGLCEWLSMNWKIHLKK